MKLVNDLRLRQILRDFELPVRLYLREASRYVEDLFSLDESKEGVRKGRIHKAANAERLHRNIMRSVREAYRDSILRDASYDAFAVWVMMAARDWHQVWMSQQPLKLAQSFIGGVGRFPVYVGGPDDDDFDSVADLVSDSWLSHNLYCKQLVSDEWMELYCVSKFHSRSHMQEFLIAEQIGIDTYEAIVCLESYVPKSVINSLNFPSRAVAQYCYLRFVYDYSRFAYVASDDMKVVFSAPGDESTMIRS